MQKVVETDEVEIGWLQDELRQSLDGENDIQAMPKKVVKELHEQLQVETSAHQQTVEAFN